MLANLHTHTWRCGHATGTDREYVEAAIRAGFKFLGFSDHCPWPFDDGYVSRIRMLPSAAPEYFASIAALREEYKSDIKIFAGFEAEWFPALAKARDELYANWPVEYMVLGMHYINDERAGLPDTYCGTPSPDPARLVRYVDLCIEALDTGKYLYLAHPDLLAFTGDDAIWNAQYGRLCDALRERNIPVEVNLHGIAGSRHYSTVRFLRLAAEHGCKATVAMDAHSPALFDRLPELLEEARRRCKEAGIEIVEPPLPGGLSADDL